MITADDFPLPPTMSIPDGGRLLYGLGRDASYDAAARGEIPARRIGRRLVLLTHAALSDLGWSDDLIARALGLSVDNDEPSQPESPPAA